MWLVEIKAEEIKALQEQSKTAPISLYNKCLRKGKVPNSQKQAEVVIIKKGEDKDLIKPKSYRPICLLNVLGKLQEKLLCKRLEECRMEKAKHNNQRGLRQGRSTGETPKKNM